MEMKYSPTNDREQGPEAETNHCCNHQPGQWDVCIPPVSMSRVKCSGFAPKSKMETSEVSMKWICFLIK